MPKGKVSATVPTAKPKATSLQAQLQTAVEKEGGNLGFYTERMEYLIQNPKFEPSQEILRAFTAYRKNGEVLYTEMYGRWVNRVPPHLVKRYTADAEAIGKTFKAQEKLVKEIHGKGTLLLYRGMTKGQGMKRGLSFWTSDRDFAAAFAGPDGLVHQATVAVDQIAYSSASNPTVQAFYKKAIKDGRGFSKNADEFLVYFDKIPKTAKLGPGIKRPEWLAKGFVENITDTETNGLVERFTKAVSDLIEEGAK